MSRIGRRLGAGSGAEIPQYIKHPAGSSGNSWLSQGDPIDAGTAHIVDNNISHLDAECMRHLVWDHAIGALANTDGWDANYSDSPNAAGGTDALPWCIAWDYRTARSYDLPAQVADRDLLDGGLGLREIRVEIYADVSMGTNLYLFAALTPTDAPPTEGAIALATAYGTLEAPLSVSGSGLLRIEIVLRTENPAGPPLEAWRTGTTTAQEQTSVPVHGGYLWVGWHSDSALNEIHSISAFEMPGPVTTTPGELGGTLVWYRADSIDANSDDYYADANRLLDLSGNERHADFAGGTKAFYGQGVGTVQLTTDGAAPMLYFSGAGGQYACPHESALNPSAWTMWFVWHDDNGSASVPWLSLFNKGSWDSGASKGKGFGLSDRTHAGAYTNVSGWVSDEIANFVDYTLSGETEVLWLQYDGAALQLWRNNVSMGSLAVGGALNDPGDLVVGGMDGDLGNQGFCGAWGECGLVNRACTDRERNDLWNTYFKPRYRRT